MKVWRGFLVLSLAVVAAFGLLGLAGCGDDAGGSSGGSSGNNTGIGGDESPFIAIYAGSTPVKLTSDKDEASLIPVNLSSFCNPDLDETCDVSAPENNEYKITFIHVENTGGATLKISEFSVDNPEYFEIRSQNGTPVPSSSADAQLEIAPSGEDGDSQYFDIVMFRPPEGLAPSTVITLRSNSDRNDGDLVLINVRAEGLAPKIQAPSNVDFDSVSQGDIQNESISILNTGTGDLEISKFVLTGHPAFTFIVGPPFMNEVKKWPVSQETASQGITFDSPIVVSPGTAATVNVQFVPEGPEPATANLILFSNDADAKSGTLIKISGNQKGPCVTINPKKVDFGGKLIGKMATVDVEVVSCGEAPLALTSIGLDIESSQDFALDLGGLPGLDPGTTNVVLDETPCLVSEDCDGGLTCHEGACAVVLDIDEAATFQVTFVPDVINELVDGQPDVDEGWINLTTNSFVSEMEVEIRGFGVETECPTAVIVVEEGEEVIPQTKLHLIGSQSYASNGGIAQYEWTVQQPVGSQSIFLPSASAPDPTFEVNVAGQYTFTLRVHDVDGEQSCVDAEYVVYVNPDEAIHVELLWDTPNDPNQTDEGPEAGADLDLHFLHPFATGQDVDGDGELDGWFDQPFDCFWFNAHPNWGSLDPMVDDDPGLDRDDTDGAGPENVNLNIPEEGLTYRVGVHYWNDHGFGPSFATVRVYIYTSLVFSVTDVQLVNHDLWEVAEIKWPSGQVDPTLGANGSYKIIPNYQHPYFFE